MGNAFALTSPPAAGDIFVTTLSFFRTSHVQDSAGGLTLSFEDIGPLTGELIPSRGRLSRTLHGTVAEVHWTFMLVCNASIMAGDRTSSISNFLVEVVNVRHYGTEFTRADLSFVR